MATPMQDQQGQPLWVSPFRHMQGKARCNRYFCFPLAHIFLELLFE
jgi:hypothetical protein